MKLKIVVNLLPLNYIPNRSQVLNAFKREGKAEYLILLDTYTTRGKIKKKFVQKSIFSKILVEMKTKIECTIRV